MSPQFLIEWHGNANGAHRAPERDSRTVEVDSLVKPRSTGGGGGGAFNALSRTFAITQN